MPVPSGPLIRVPDSIAREPGRRRGHLAVVCKSSVRHCTGAGAGVGGACWVEHALGILVAQGFEHFLLLQTHDLPFQAAVEEVEGGNVFIVEDGWGIGWHLGAMMMMIMRKVVVVVVMVSLV